MVNSALLLQKLGMPSEPPRMEALAPAPQTPPAHAPRTEPPRPRPAEHLWGATSPTSLGLIMLS